MWPVAPSTRNEVVLEAQGQLHHARGHFVDFVVLLVQYGTKLGHVRRSREPSFLLICVLSVYCL